MTDTEQMVSETNGLTEQLQASIALVGRDEVEDSMAADPPLGYKPQRKRRSDAGRPRQKPAAIAQKPPAKAAEWVQRLKDMHKSLRSLTAQLEANRYAGDLLQEQMDRTESDIEAVYAEMLKGE